MAARFLASAFASGPALLILLCMIVRKFSRFDPGREPLQALAKITAYAMTANVFFLGLEFFTAYYSGIPAHRHSLDYLFFGLEGHGLLVPFMRAAAVFAVIGLAILINPGTRRRDGFLAAGAVAVFLSTWIDKGLGLVVGGFIPNPFEAVVEYVPTVPELAISLGVWAVGFLALTVLFKIAIAVREEE
jgi:molybdopterin-containing oxidoreductase family membrane subunit